jgi:dipeptidase D
MQRISELPLVEVWRYFEEILAIPRISKREAAITEYLKVFATQRGLPFQSDPAGNLLISKPATSGMESRKGIILQSHLDMVGEKTAEVDHDFEHDSIRATIDTGWIRAGGTTLGADDGIGIAASMAILDSENIPHGPMECLFTVEEESGMTGALGLTPGFLKGSLLLNLDSEDEGELFIGCAGGIDTVAVLKLKKKRIPRNSTAFMVTVEGLKGGHSGDEIHRGLGNSIKILNRFLWNANQRFSIGLARLEGGSARNAIPREASAVITFPSSAEELIRVYLESYSGIVAKELEVAEPELRLKIKRVELPGFILGRKQQKKLFNALYACPHGVVAMSQEIPGLVETSTNLASVRIAEGTYLEIVTSQRSSVESAKRDIADRVTALFNLLGARIRHSVGYPEWKPNLESEILGIARNAYQELFGTEARVKAIHAGLECGLFLQKYPELDMISFGPTIKGAHTPEERINIGSVDKFWKLLLLILEKVPDGKPGLH